MSYRAELNDAPQCIRYDSSASVLFHWPKLDGVGNITLTAATFTLYKPNNSTPTIDAQAATIVTSGGYTKLTYSVNSTDTDTYLIAENYRAVWEYTYSVDSIPRRYSHLVDVAIEPFLPSVSLNSFVEEDVSAEDILTRQAAIIESGRTAEQHASVLALKAWADVRDWFRQALSKDGKILPRAIMDRHSVHRVVVAQALHKMYSAEGGGLDSESRFLADEWGKKAVSIFKNLPPLEYDSGGDGIPDTDVRGPVSQTPIRGWR